MIGRGAIAALASALALVSVAAQSARAGADVETQALEALAAGRWREAREVLESWRAREPRSEYVLRLLARARESERTAAEAVDVYQALAAAAPSDRRVRARLEELLQINPGLFMRAFDAKAIAPEAVETPAPQRVVYETREASARARARAGERFDALASASTRQLSQRNLTQGFSYFDVLEQRYSAGAEARPASGLSLAAEYAQSIFSDIHGSAVGRRTFAGARAGARWLARPGALLTLSGERAPFLLRGAAGSRFFSLLGRTSADAGADAALGAWSLTAQAGFDAYSDRTTARRARVSAEREWAAGAFTPSYIRGQQEFYGATAAGRVGLADFDRFGLRWSRYAGPVRAEAQYGRSLFADGNRRHDGQAALESAPELARGFSARYEFSASAWSSLTPLYRSYDEQAHWAGGFWARGSASWDARAGAEHGWARDARGAWQADRLSCAASWRPAGSASITGSAQALRATVGDDAFRAGLDARWSF